MDNTPNVVVVHSDEDAARRYCDWVPESYGCEWVTPNGASCEVPDDVEVVVADSDLPADCYDTILGGVEAPEGSVRAELLVLYGADETIDPPPLVTASIRVPTTRENFQETIRRRALLQLYRNQFKPLGENVDDASAVLGFEDGLAQADADAILEELLEVMSLQEIMVELFR